MCLLVVLNGTHPAWPLVVGANRDEALDRAAVPMTVLRERGPRVIGGRDEVAGGTWLAVNDAGVVAGLTNRPRQGGKDPTKKSRGELPLALAGHTSAAAAVEAFRSQFDPRDYNAAWLIVGDRDGAWSIDMSGDDAPDIRRLPPGVHILENRPLGAPSPKVDQVRSLLGDVTALASEQAFRHLKTVLSDHQVPAGASAADEAGLEGAPVEVKAACVHGERFATRWSGLIAVPEAAEALPVFEYADGPGCTSPYISAASFWSGTPVPS